jgi:hypothetical protein
LLEHVQFAPLDQELTDLSVNHRDLLIGFQHAEYLKKIKHVDNCRSA